MARNVSSVPKARSAVRCPPPGLGSPRFCSSEHVARAPLRSVWHLIPRELGQRGRRLLRRPRISGVYFICPPHCFLVLCRQRTCSTWPCSPGPCSPVHCIHISAVTFLRVGSLHPAPLGIPPPITPPGGLRSRGESNVIITNALVILAAVKPDFSCWVTAAMVQALSYHNLQDKRSACAASTRI